MLSITVYASSNAAPGLLAAVVVTVDAATKIFPEGAGEQQRD
jgi:hypothetical protein